MSTRPSESPIELLRWLVEAGADEAIADTPVSRFSGAVPSAREALLAGKDPSREVAPTRRDPGFAERSPPSPSDSNRRPSIRLHKEVHNIASSAEAVSLATAPGAARALAASCTSLAELKTALEQFDGCELKRFATNTVFADGNPSSRIMLVGEAPGRDEDLQGIPFVGRAGKLLDRMLVSIGLDRTKVYITNVLNWRPPQNREPTPEEAATMLPFLHRHIELADPQILILLGAVSVRHVLGRNEGITRMRGKWDVYQSAGLGRAIPAMPTLHPAYLLRQPGAKRLAWRDLLLVAEKIESLGLA